MLQTETIPILKIYFFLTFIITSILAKPTFYGSNPLGIDISPAPPPELGPPLSAHASRDKDLLPAQIGGIVGAYLFSLCCVGTILLILGKRLRRQVELDAKSLEIELVASNFQGVYTGSTGPTPVTPANLRNFSWPSPDKTHASFQFPPVVNPDPNAFVFPSQKLEYETGAYVYPPSQSIYSHQSNLSIDNKILEADREMLARDLEDIYAHVMEQEDAKAAGVDVRSMPPPSIPGVSPTSSPQAKSKNGKHKPTDINTSMEKPAKTHSRASSILSSLTSPRSPKEPKSPRRKGIRGLRISSPISTPASAAFHPSDEEPLTPRSYVHRAPPPIPRGQNPYSTNQPESDSPTRSIAETLSTITPTSPQHPQASQSRSILPALNTRNLRLSLKSDKKPSSPRSPSTNDTQYPTNVRPTPSKSSLSQPTQNKYQQPQSQPPTNSHTKSQSANSGHSPISSSSTVVASTSRSLPFRQYEPALASPSFVPSTKTTVLERIPASARNGGPQTAGLRTPFSGGAVPYSPYQPFTPMMPITPRLVTKEDRKRMKKAMPRTPVVEMVRNEEDLWDDGY